MSMHEFKKLGQVRHIIIDIVPKSSQKAKFPYGDYGHEVSTGTLWIKISEYEDPMYAIFLAVHELLEASRCIKGGVSLQSINQFDKSKMDDDVDPGQLADAPYHPEHMLSMQVEKLLCRQEGYSFKKYEAD